MTPATPAVIRGPIAKRHTLDLISAAPIPVAALQDQSVEIANTAARGASWAVFSARMLNLALARSLGGRKSLDGS
jgi:hypothetical protein